MFLNSRLLWMHFVWVIQVTFHVCYVNPFSHFGIKVEEMLPNQPNLTKNVPNWKNLLMLPGKLGQLAWSQKHRQLAGQLARATMVWSNNAEWSAYLSFKILSGQIQRVWYVSILQRVYNFTFPQQTTYVSLLSLIHRKSFKP